MLTLQDKAALPLGEGPVASAKGTVDTAQYRKGGSCYYNISYPNISLVMSFETVPYPPTILPPPPLIHSGGLPVILLVTQSLTSDPHSAGSCCVTATGDSDW